MINIRRREYEFLNGEINSWLDENIITSEQSEKILSLYEIKEYSLKRILILAGVILLGLGAVSFLASKWHELPKLLRLCVLIGGYALSLIACSISGIRTKAGKSFLLLASFILGSGIFLGTRMYNIKLDLSQILEFWLLAEIVTCMITSDLWQVYLLEILSLIYLIVINAIDIFALQFMNSAHFAMWEFFVPVKAFILLALLWLVNWRIRTRAIINANILITLLLCASRMSLCLGGTLTLVILAIIGGVMSFLMKHSDGQTMGLLIAGVFGLLLTWPEFWNSWDYAKILSVVSALCLVPLMLINIWRGHLVAGVVFCVLLVCRYFFDSLFGFMPKAWGFTLLGLIFMLIGVFFEKLRTHESAQDGNL
ncbi:MAG: DUF2157 domain-containing protein [Synergistaceae bacterium]|nr:DUF2157 domain-containing protein [Synergistaceae bacterium]